MGDRSHGKRVNSKRRRLAREYQRQHGCSYRTALQAVQKNEPIPTGHGERINTLAMEIKNYITPWRPPNNHVRETLNANDALKDATRGWDAWEDFFHRQANRSLRKQLFHVQHFMRYRYPLVHDQKSFSLLSGVDVAFRPRATIAIGKQLTFPPRGTSGES